MPTRRTIHTVGTLSIASGAAVLILSLSVVFVGIAVIVTNTATTSDALGNLVQAVPVRGSLLGGPQELLSLGLLGAGIGVWLLGAGLVLQGRTER
ncbi:hypothetical protein [Haladaptatus sp. NG-SE-30]